MPDNLDSLGIFKIPASATWDTITAGLLARVDALEFGHLIELGFTVGNREVAWVTVYRSADDVVLASGPHGPYESPNRQSWSWDAVDEPEQPARSTLIASTVTTFLRSLDDIPSDEQSLSLDGTVHFRVATPASGFVNREPQWDSYAQHRTGAQLDKLLHYGHFIPMGKGYTQQHVEENFPGWTWSGLLEVLKAADVFVGRGGTPPRCQPTVKAIHFTDARTWAVEWLSGEITRSACP
ncbi:hypothetical protein [Rhodoglobus aureus]|uniref:DUF317 domain-containing protein n=1 Tax=Rhodoglobus aureus TaxID=191497 RepID=A0ABN1VGV0_9MICO